MKIVIVSKKSRIPVFTYGGTQRDIWAQGKVLHAMGHQVVFVVQKGSECPFAEIIPYNNKLPLNEQIPQDADMVHLHSNYREPLDFPNMATVHGNGKPGEVYHVNTVFVSQNHAQRHGSERYVYNGLDFDLLGTPKLNARRNGLLFLAKASRSIKNLKGSRRIARQAAKTLHVAGGYGLPLSRKVRYYGMVGGEKKNQIIQGREALLFPVLWHEPLGLAILESLYFGLPVFGTTYGSLPELVGTTRGFLSNSESELARATQHIGDFDRKACHEFIADNFSARKMTEDYLALYEEILNGHTLNHKPPHTLPEELAEPFPMTA